jgi:hypothetical protein
MESDFNHSSFAEMVSSNTSSSPPDMNSSNNWEILQMLSTISSQMSSNYQALQDNIVKNDLCLTANFQNVIQEMDTFKQQVREEIDMLRNNLPPVLGFSSSNSNNVTLSVPSSPQAQSNSLPPTLLVNSMAGFNLSSPQDFQT